MTPEQLALNSALFSLATGYVLNCKDSYRPKLVRYGPEVGFETVKTLLHQGLVEVTGDGLGLKISDAGVKQFYRNATIVDADGRSLHAQPTAALQDPLPNKEHKSLEDIEALLY